MQRAAREAGQEKGRVCFSPLSGRLGLSTRTGQERGILPPDGLAGRLAEKRPVLDSHNRSTPTLIASGVAEVPLGRLPGEGTVSQVAPFPRHGGDPGPDSHNTLTRIVA